MKGQIDAALGNIESSYSAYQKSINILEDLGSQLELGRAFYQRGRLWGIQDQSEKASKDLQKAAEIFKQCGAKHDLKLTQELIQSI